MITSLVEAIVRLVDSMDLAANDVLKYEVATPAGGVKVLNQCSNSDLFFADKGVRVLCYAINVFTITLVW